MNLSKWFTDGQKKVNKKKYPALRGNIPKMGMTKARRGVRSKYYWKA